MTTIIDKKPYNDRRIIFHDKRIQLKENPRTNICSKCGKKYPDDLREQTIMHHEEYDPNNVLAHTVELCRGCHISLHKKGKSNIRRNTEGLTEWGCLRCGHYWWSKNFTALNPPKRCPKCQAYYNMHKTWPTRMIYVAEQARQYFRGEKIAMNAPSGDEEHGF